MVTSEPKPSSLQAIFAMTTSFWGFFLSLKRYFISILIWMCTYTPKVFLQVYEEEEECFIHPTISSGRLLAGFMRLLAQS